MVKAVLLALLAFAGPLRAQLIYACSIMEQSFEGTCCCEDHDQGQTGLAARDCVPGSPGSPDLTEQACCDTDFQFSVSQDTADSILGPSQATRNADPDPPQLIAVLPADSPAGLASRTAARHAAGAPVPWNTGTATYLLTQRLRI